MGHGQRSQPKGKGDWARVSRGWAGVREAQNSPSLDPKSPPSPSPSPVAAACMEGLARVQLISGPKGLTPLSQNGRVSPRVPAGRSQLLQQ